MTRPPSLVNGVVGDSPMHFAAVVKREALKNFPMASMTRPPTMAPADMIRLDSQDQKVTEGLHHIQPQLLGVEKEAVESRRGKQATGQMDLLKAWAQV